jgi:hypothetical protein
MLTGFKRYDKTLELEILPNLINFFWLKTLELRVEAKDVLISVEKLSPAVRFRL